MLPKKARQQPDDEDKEDPTSVAQNDDPEADDGDILPVRPSYDIFAPTPPEPGMPGSSHSPFDDLPDGFRPAQGWEAHTSTTPLQHAAMLDEVVRLLPGLIADMQYQRLYHARPDQRQGDNMLLSSLLLLENDLLDISNGPCLVAGDRIRDPGRQYPEAISDLVLRLAEMNDALFVKMMPALMTRCWFAHIAPPSGKDGQHLGIAQVQEVWQTHMARIVEEPLVGEFFSYDWPPEVDVPSLPDRKPVKIDGYTKRGWPKVRFDTEAGYQSLVRLAHVKRLGQMLIRQHDS